MKSDTTHSLETLEYSDGVHFILTLCAEIKRVRTKTQLLINICVVVFCVCGAVYCISVCIIYTYMYCGITYISCCCFVV